MINCSHEITSFTDGVESLSKRKTDLLVDIFTNKITTKSKSPTWSYGGHWNDPMTNKLPSFFKGGDPQRGQSGKDHLPERSSQFFPDEAPLWPSAPPQSSRFSLSHLFKDNWLLIPHWVDGIVVLGGLGLQCFSSGVCGKSEHFYLYVHPHPPLGQKLTWNHLTRIKKKSSGFNLAGWKSTISF